MKMTSKKTVKSGLGSRGLLVLYSPLQFWHGQLVQPRVRMCVNGTRLSPQKDLLGHGGDPPQLIVLGRPPPSAPHTHSWFTITGATHHLLWQTCQSPAKVTQGGRAVPPSIFRPPVFALSVCVQGRGVGARLWAGGSRKSMEVWCPGGSMAPVYTPRGPMQPTDRQMVASPVSAQPAQQREGRLELLIPGDEFYPSLSPCAHPHPEGRGKAGGEGRK